MLFAVEECALKRRLAAIAALITLLWPSEGGVGSVVEAASKGTQTETIAMHYRKGMFERVARNRGMPTARRMAAVNDCGRIGQWVRARVNGYTDWFYVLDCSAPRDAARHRRMGLVIEIDYRSAVEFGFSTRGRAPAVLLGWKKQLETLIDA